MWCVKWAVRVCPPWGLGDVARLIEGEEIGSEVDIYLSTRQLLRINPIKAPGKLYQ